MDRGNDKPRVGTGIDKPRGTGQGQATAPTTGQWNEWDRVKVLLHERFVIVNHIGTG